MSYPYGPPGDPSGGFGQDVGGYQQAAPGHPPQHPGFSEPYPGQAGVPAADFGQQPSVYPMPAYPATPVGYPAPPGYSPYAPQPTASGGTAIAAGVSACVASVLSLVGGVIMLVAASIVSDSGDSYSGRYRRDDELYGLFLGIGALALLVGVLWAVGGILLFMRKQAGRVMLIVLSSIAVVLGVIGLANGPGTAFVSLVFSIAILVLAAVPPTGRWIEAGKQTPAVVQPYYPYY
ncbi:hypothetical protein ACFROC_35185 [Nocardia tengchongensis]|uniref:hypothetical protein n=1 Tax=Nocardia tengchongensis TaxID=2055889 RepID=UPI0036B84FBC